MSTDTTSEIPITYTSTSIEAYGAYPFSSDETYQQGLASILTAGGSTLADTYSPPEVREELERRTRVFYFNRIAGSSITMNEARDYELSLLTSTTVNNASIAVNGAQVNSPDTDENRVLTFAELKELIESGNIDKIPNNKIIPETLNDAPPSQSTAPTKKKPWEVETTSSP